jgi:hypothetical protein
VRRLNQRNGPSAGARWGRPRKTREMLDHTFHQYATTSENRPLFNFAHYSSSCAGGAAGFSIIFRMTNGSLMNAAAHRARFLLQCFDPSLGFGLRQASL